MTRVVIIGGPRTGKTTSSVKLAHRTRILDVRHTDDLVGVLDWSAASEEVARWLDEPGPWVIEGGSCARALRKWLAAHPEGKPCDQVIGYWRPWVELTPGQSSMAKGVVTVWREIHAEIVRRGVSVIHESVWA